MPRPVPPRSRPGRRSARQRSGQARPGQSARQSRRRVPEVPLRTRSLRRSCLAKAYATVGQATKHARVTVAAFQQDGTDLPALIASRSVTAWDRVDTFTIRSPAGTVPAVSEQLPGGVRKTVAP